MKLSAIIGGLLLAMTAFTQSITADLLITNAVVRTMDTNQPLAEAVAMIGNRIVAVGSNAKLVEAAGPKTKIIDARGRLVLPGFNDAHVHFLSGGFQLSQVDLRTADSPAELTRRIQEFAARAKPGAWITGGDWDHERWTGAPLPTKLMIDAATTNVPVFVSRLDGHMALANSTALKLAGITRETKSPAGGLIVTNQSGEPTGLLKDAAMDLVYGVIPAATFDEKLTAARDATEHAARFGVTSVQDMSAGADVGVYQELLRRGELKTRIYGFSPLPNWERLAASGVRAAFGSDMLRIGGLKGFSMAASVRPPLCSSNLITMSRAPRGYPPLKCFPKAQWRSASKSPMPPGCKSSCTPSVTKLTTQSSRSSRTLREQTARVTVVSALNTRNISAPRTSPVSVEAA